MIVSPLKRSERDIKDTLTDYVDWLKRQKGKESSKGTFSFGPISRVVKELKTE